MSTKKEIEIKIEISATDFNKVHNYLSDNCDAIEDVTQHDTYFTPSNENFMDEKYPYKWFSLRIRGEKNKLSFKHFFPEGDEKHNYCNEYEVGFDDINALNNILSELEFTIVADVRKHRKTFVYKDRFHISLDNVEMLGYFLEIELIADDGDYVIEKENMLNIIREMGITEYRVDLRGYPFLVYEKTKNMI